MAVKIKLARFGKIREPHYRIVVADSRTRRAGRTIENIGLYQPKSEPSLIEVDSERVQYWLGVGAQPTEPVLGLLKVTGDWQKFKGLPGAEGTLQQPESKAAFVAEDKGSVIIPEAITPKAEKTEDSAESEDAPAETAEAEAEKAE